MEKKTILKCDYEEEIIPQTTIKKFKCQKNKNSRNTQLSNSSNRVNLDDALKKKRDRQARYREEHREVLRQRQRNTKRTRKRPSRKEYMKKYRQKTKLEKQIIKLKKLKQIINSKLQQQTQSKNLHSQNEFEQSIKQNKIRNCNYIEMSERAKSCYIRSNSDTLSTVYLPDSSPVFIGRSEGTNITDIKCSRKQVRLCADYAQRIVTVQQIGPRACGINGFKTQKDDRFIVKHNDLLEILYGKYVYQIEFNPPPKNDRKSVRKQSYDSEDESLSIDPTNSSKMRKIENESNATTIQKIINNENNCLINKEDNKEINAMASTSKQNDVNDSTIKTTGLWESNKELLIYTPSNVLNRTKIAAYDMDGTLIKTKSGLVFPKDVYDWQLLDPRVPKKLKQLYEDGYKIVIFTNQGALGTGKVKIEDFKMKIERIIQKLGVPIQVFISMGKNIYRKPLPGMWNKLVNDKNGGSSIDKSNSFYVGDAAGREKNWAPGRKKDHSKVDRLMAMNIGLQFQTPEEHFFGHKVAPYILPTFNPKALKKDGNPVGDAKIISQQQEIILMVGSPGSGKSHFAKAYLTDYDYINRDTLGSWQKCISALKYSLIQQKRVVIDNTNPDPASRKRYIEIAKEYNVPIRCFLMTTSTEHAKHNNKYRELIDSSHAKINDIIINSYMKNYVPPTLEEGFAEIVKVNFIPRFSSEKDQELYEMYLLEN